jgi:shikimate dehydrogenase
MHNAGYAALHLPYRFVAFGTEQTTDAVKAVRSLGIRGLSVSMPHKVRIMQYLDEIDDTAQTIGAVNTIVNTDGHPKGYTTDWTGPVRALEEQTVLHGKNVAVIGAGGAGRAVVYGLARHGAQVTIFNRTASKAQALAQDFDATFGGELSQITTLALFDIIVNTTSVGFMEDVSILAPTVFSPGQVVLDAAFIPPETKLLRLAKNEGCITVFGTRMLVHQATCQFELYTGETAPIEAMEAALIDAIADLG